MTGWLFSRVQERAVVVVVVNMDGHETEDEQAPIRAAVPVDDDDPGPPEYMAHVPDQDFFGRAPRDRPIYNFYKQGLRIEQRKRRNRPPPPPIRCSWCWANGPQQRQVTVPEDAVCEQCESTVNPRPLDGPEAVLAVDPPVKWLQGEMCYGCHLQIHAGLPQEDLPLFMPHTTAADIVRRLQNARPQEILEYQQQQYQQQQQERMFSANPWRHLGNRFKKRVTMPAEKMKNDP
jgi:hypothetical protein